MNVSWFKTFSVKVVLDFRNVSNAHIVIYMICAVCLFGVTKCSALYMLLMYQLRSSGAEVAVCPQVSQIGVDVVVWAIVSEYAV